MPASVACLRATASAPPEAIRAEAVTTLTSTFFSRGLESLKVVLKRLCALNDLQRSELPSAPRLEGLGLAMEEECEEAMFRLGLRPSAAFDVCFQRRVCLLWDPFRDPRFFQLVIHPPGRSGQVGRGKPVGGDAVQERAVGLAHTLCVAAEKEEGLRQPLAGLQFAELLSA